MKTLEIKNLQVKIENKVLIDNLNLKINKGETHVLLGPNGAGKSTLLNTIMGHPFYDITKGEILLDNQDITKLDSDKRAQLGLFLSFQHPAEIDGVTMANFLRTAYNSTKQKNTKLQEFKKILKEHLDLLDLDNSFRIRNVNKGFSGGEKKRSELLQFSLLEPHIAMLDEIDSGLDVDGLKLVAKTIETIKKNNNTTLLIVSHHNKFLKYLKVDKVHILQDKKIKKSGDIKIIEEVEELGFK